jgi:hypothetical protein
VTASVQPGMHAFKHGFAVDGGVVVEVLVVAAVSVVEIVVVGSKVVEDAEVSVSVVEIIFVGSEVVETINDFASAIVFGFDEGESVEVDIVKIVVNTSVSVDEGVVVDVLMSAAVSSVMFDAIGAEVVEDDETGVSIVEIVVVGSEVEDIDVFFLEVETAKAISVEVAIMVVATVASGEVVGFTESFNVLAIVALAVVVDGAVPIS